MKKDLLKNIKILAFDVDGTILEYPKYQLNTEIQEMFKSLKSKGYITTLVTARDMITIGDIKNVPNIDYFIGANGAFIYDLKNQKMLWELDFKYSDFIKIKQFMDENHLDYYVSGKNKAFNSHNFDMNNWFVKPHKNQFQTIDNITKSDKLNFIDIVTKSQELIKDTKEFVKNLDMSVSSTWYGGCFISPIGVDKSTTLDILSKMINSKYSIGKNVMSFGDGDNDIKMLIKSHHGVVMGSASDYLKSIGDDIADDVKHNGVKLYLEKIGMI